MAVGLAQGSKEHKLVKAGCEHGPWGFAVAHGSSPGVGGFWPWEAPCFATTLLESRKLKLLNVDLTFNQ